MKTHFKKQFLDYITSSKQLAIMCVAKVAIFAGSPGDVNAIAADIQARSDVAFSKVLDAAARLAEAVKCCSNAEEHEVFIVEPGAEFDKECMSHRTSALERNKHRSYGGQRVLTQPQESKFSTRILCTVQSGVKRIIPCPENNENESAYQHTSVVISPAQVVYEHEIR